MHDVLMIYKQAGMQFDENGSIIMLDDGHMTHTVSYDEKLGVQAIANKHCLSGGAGLYLGVDEREDRKFKKAG